MNSIIIAEVSTGVPNTTRMAVINKDHTLIGMRKNDMPGARMRIIVVI